MGKKTLNLDDRLYDYLIDVSLRDNPIHKELRDLTDQHEMGMMQISADQAQFMSLLLRLINARKVIEIGTFTGYSALVMAEALPANGTLIACDVNDEWTRIGKPFWERAGIANKIDLRLAPAIETLKGLIDNGQQAQFDFAFIDADKENQQQYYEFCFQLIRPHGLIAIDNTLWGGSVADPANQEESTVAIRKFNEALFNDERVDMSLIPIGDGLSLARKR